MRKGLFSCAHAQRISFALNTALERKMDSRVSTISLVRLRRILIVILSTYDLSQGTDEKSICRLVHFPSEICMSAPRFRCCMFFQMHSMSRLPYSSAIDGICRRKGKLLCSRRRICRKMLFRPQRWYCRKRCKG